MIIYKSSEEVNKSIILPLENSIENSFKSIIDTSNISELINQFENLTLTYLGSKPLITYKNCRWLNYYTWDCWSLMLKLLNRNLLYSE